MGHASNPLVGGLYVLVGLGFLAVSANVYRTKNAVAVQAFSGFLFAGGLWAVSAGVLYLYLFWLNLGHLVFGSMSTLEGTGLFFLTELSLLSGFAAVVLWLVFTLQYTSRIDRSKRLLLKYGVAVAIGAYVPFWTLYLADTMRLLTRLVPEKTLVPNVLRAIIGIPWILAFTGILFVTGAQLYRTYLVHEYFSRSLTFSLLSVLPFLTVFGIKSWGTGTEPPSSTFALVLAAIALGGVWAAVYRFDLFEELPAAYAVGVETAVDAQDPGLVVLDVRDRVTRLNPAARNLLDADSEGVLGDPFASLLPYDVDASVVLSPESTEIDWPGRDRIIELRADDIESGDGGRIGRTVHVRDVTTQRRRQQRVEVLNRVLRHNLRNEISTVTALSDIIRSEGADPIENADRIYDQATKLVELSEKAREIERVLAADRVQSRPKPLATIIERVVAQQRDTHPDATMTVQRADDKEGSLWANERIVEAILVELIANAVEHTPDAEPEVTVQFAVESDGATIAVADSGPGIPEYEVEVFETGEETPLEHGSGLGLWLVKWGVDRLGGTIDFQTSDGGTTVEIEIPGELVAPPELSPDQPAPTQ